MNKMLDPIEGSAAYNMEVLGVVALHVDDLLMTGNSTFHSTVVARLRKDYQVGSEDKDDIVFTGQRLRWLNNAIVMDQDKAVEELSEIQLEKKLNDEADCTPAMHTEYRRSLLGSLNWLQSRTQFQIAYKFSRAASAAAAPKNQTRQGTEPDSENSESQATKTILLATQERIPTNRISRCFVQKQRRHIVTAWSLYIPC